MKKYFKNYLLFLLFLTCSSVMADSTSTVAIGLTIDSTVVIYDRGTGTCHETVGSK